VKLPRAIIDFPGLSDETPDARLRFDDPVEVIVASDASEVIPSLKHAAQCARAGRWVAGWIAYEAAPAFEPLMSVKQLSQGAGDAHVASDVPLLLLGVYTSPDIEPPPRAHTEGEQWWSHLSWMSDTGDSEFSDAVCRIRDAIEAGETYQVNYTNRLRAALPHASETDLELWYETLRAAQGSGLHAMIETDSHAVLSASPELFFEVRQNRIRTRPMKGTSRRGRWLAEDEALRDAMLQSPKERAENLMIVDLLRNDIGRVAATGTVDVPAMFTPERYETLWQLTSTVEAELRDGTDVVDIFRSLFPCGSVTGAPKINTMKWIDALETSPRGVYCGAIGVIKPDGDCMFSVPIRTVVVDKRRRNATYGVGSGITIDSSAERELAEFREKAMVLSRRRSPFELLETMRLENGSILRMSQHLRRIKQSAAYFGYTLDIAQLTHALQGLCVAHEDARRVRVTASRDGVFTIDADQAAPPRYAHQDDCRRLRAIQCAAVAHDAVISDDPFLCNKTTNRGVYDRARAGHRDVFDVLLWNERDEITEFTTGNVVVELHGRLITPPLQCGLLGGVFREAILSEAVVTEDVVTRAMLSDATRVWLVNSLREWVEVKLDG
jgi:para-aminobenzoate synthetase/4-amino-4-deoxychorismate lyase